MWPERIVELLWVGGGGSVKDVQYEANHICLALHLHLTFAKF